MHIFRTRGALFFDAFHSYVTHDTNRSHTHDLSDIILTINVTYLINSNVPRGVLV